jgi:hypothetical protein
MNLKMELKKNTPLVMNTTFPHLSCFVNVVKLGEMRNEYNGIVRQLKVKRYFGDIGVYERIILKWILEKQNKVVSTGFVWFRIATRPRLL